MTQQRRHYVESRIDIVKGIKRALDDIEAGRTIPHDEANAPHPD
jgi:predicted transcriptional regulator